MVRTPHQLNECSVVFIDRAEARVCCGAPGPVSDPRPGARRTGQVFVRPAAPKGSSHIDFPPTAHCLILLFAPKVETSLDPLILHLDFGWNLQAFSTYEEFTLGVHTLAECPP